MLGRQALKTKRTREAIINAVISLIKEGGFAAASSSKIAERAGTTWGAVQHHFGTKEDILDSILEMSHERFTIRMADAALRTGSLADRVSLFVDRMWAHYQEDLYLVALEILLATRAFSGKVSANLQKRQARSHLKTLREVFHDSKLDDTHLLEALRFTHCFLDGLTIERVFETRTRNVDRHLQRIKMAMLIMLTEM
ncbi:MAG: TetR/AcrR family transcriptional regulator [Nevskia sp.]|nr:TetR/AcrR family transcriptional regulator [Nevskia sp.]